MIDKDKVIKKFGSIRQAANSIGVSRLTIYTWIDNGEIPEKCTRGKSKGANWHNKLKDLGLSPSLNRLKPRL